MPKRRANGEGNITKRNDGLWMGQFTDNTGKRRTVYGKTQQEAKRKKEEAQRQSEKGLSMDKNKMTFNEWLMEWLEVYHKPIVKESTYACTHEIIYKHVIPAFPKVLLKDLRADMLQRFFNDKAINGKIRKVRDHETGVLVQDQGGLSVGSLKKIKCCISSSLDQAVENSLIPENVSKKIKLQKGRRKEVRVLSSDEQKKLEAVIRKDKNPLDFCMLLDLYTGLRIGELLALKINDINFDKKELTVRRSKRRVPMPETKDTKIIVSEPKTDKGQRIIPLPDFLLNMIWVQIEYRNTFVDAMKNKWGDKWKDEGYLFITPSGTTPESSNIYSSLMVRLKQAEIGHISFHALRHTFATRCIEAGFDVKALSEILGHTDVRMTLDTYTHALEEQKRTNMEKLAHLFSLNANDEE